MAKMTRRAMLWATSTGVATLAGVAALVSSKQHSTSAEAAASTGATASGSITAFVKDASRGTISVFQGEREIVVNAPDLVRALANIAK